MYIRCYKYVDNWLITRGCVFLKCFQLFSKAYGETALLHTLDTRFDHMTCFASPNVNISSMWGTFKVTVRINHHLFLCVQAIAMFWSVPALGAWICDQEGCPKNL